MAVSRSAVVTPCAQTGWDQQSAKASNTNGTRVGEPHPALFDISCTETNPGPILSGAAVHRFPAVFMGPAGGLCSAIVVARLNNVHRSVANRVDQPVLPVDPTRPESA